MTAGTLAADDMRPLVGETFDVARTDGGLEPLVLVTVTDLVEAGLSAAQPGRRHAFSAVFRGPNGPGYLRQQTYPVSHGRFGTMDVFLVPIGPDEQGMRYEAIFS